MIVTEIFTGQGLGNQLACYITTRVIAADRGFDFGIQSPENFKCLDFMDLDFGKPVHGGDGPPGGPPDHLPDGITHYYKERLIRHPVTNADISTRDPELVAVPDNTKIDGVMQGEEYVGHRKEEIRQWLAVRPEYECYDYSADDICVINFRGGEYRFIQNVFLPQQYWDNAVAHMRSINPRMRFVVITHDVKTAKKFFPKFQVYDLGIAKDYTAIKNAHYLILANTSFAWFPAWLSERLKFCIAPKYWWAHNISDGYWACNYNITSSWLYLDRDGHFSDYDTCRRERDAYVAAHAELYQPKQIERNMLVVSNHNNDLSWVPRRTSNYVIYDRSDKGTLPYTVDHTKIIRSPNVGYNLYDYFTYIIDHYDHLPECVIFTKSNLFPRHVSEQYFDSVSNNTTFTPLEEGHRHATRRPVSFIDNNGGFNEVNNRWYMSEHPYKYFASFDDFLRFCYQNPTIPQYVRFAPGANYIVPRENILRVPKSFYRNLRMIISHQPFTAEAHIVERALYHIWTSDEPISPAMTRVLTEEELPRAPLRQTIGGSRQLKALVMRIEQGPFRWISAVPQRLYQWLRRGK